MLGLIGADELLEGLVAVADVVVVTAAAWVGAVTEGLVVLNWSCDTMLGATEDMAVCTDEEDWPDEGKAVPLPCTATVCGCGGVVVWSASG